MSEWVVLLHVAVAFWFVAGLLGRNITMAKARAATDIGTLQELVELSGRFERLMVIPGSFAVLVAGLLAAWAQGQPLAGADDWWLLTSLILFVAVGVLVPTVFLPHGKVFESALEDAKRRGEVTPEQPGDPTLELLSLFGPSSTSMVEPGPSRNHPLLSERGRLGFRAAG